MTLFLIRRLQQSIVVLLVMSFVVFAGVFAIGNPIDSLISLIDSGVKIDAVRPKIIIQFKIMKMHSVNSLQLIAEFSTASLKERVALARLGMPSAVRRR